MQNASTQKLDIHKETMKYERRLKTLKEDKTINQENKKIILNFIKDCELGKVSGQQCSPNRILKYIYLLTRINQFFENKPFDKLRVDDIERVISDLRKGKYKKQRVNLVKDPKRGRILQRVLVDKPLGSETVVDFEKTIKRLISYIHGTGDKYQKLAGWIKSKNTIKEIPALSREEVEKLAEACNLKYKSIIMFLFDSGARVGELLNIRIGDLTKKEDHYNVRIKHSKTKPRTISVPMCTKLLDSWLASHPEKDNPMAQLFPVTYDGLRVYIKELGKRILKQNTYIHLFRHSSATYYCNKLNQYQLCYRYGWSMTSDQPQRYIDREGVEEEATAELYKADEINRYKKQAELMQEKLLMVKSNVDRIDDQMAEKDERNDLVFNEIVKIFKDLMKDKDRKKEFMDAMSKTNLGKVLRRERGLP